MIGGIVPYPVAAVFVDNFICSKESIVVGHDAASRIGHTERLDDKSLLSLCIERPSFGNECQNYLGICGCSVGCIYCRRCCKGVYILMRECKLGGITLNKNLDSLVCSCKSCIFRVEKLVGVDRHSDSRSYLAGITAIID